MTSSAPSPEIDLSWQMREREALLLAELMRSSRLTVLYGETGPGRTLLLTGGVVPLLRRRETDTVGKTSREARVVIPFPDRRSRQAGRHPARMAELVVFFDEWSADPSSGLRHSILEAAPMRAVASQLFGASLADMLETLGQQQDLQFLIVLDRFEELIALDVALNERFIDEFCEAVNRIGLCANFMLSLSDDAKPRLESLRQRIPGFDDFSVRLLRWNSVVEQPPVLDDVAPAAGVKTWPQQMVPVLQGSFETLRNAEPKVALPSADRPGTPGKAARINAKLARAAAGSHVPIETSAVYAFIESTLIQTAKSSRSDTWQNVAQECGTASEAPVRIEENEGMSENYLSSVQPAVETLVRETPPRDTVTSQSPRPAADRGGASSTASVSLHSALKWLERRIRPKL